MKGEQLAGKVSIVTGGGSGIGRAIALRFAGEGSAVAIADLNLSAAEQVAAEIQAQGGKALAVRADVSSSADVNAMVAQVAGHFDVLSVLVNCAGIVVRSSLDKTTDEEWMRELAVDLTSVFLCTRAAAPRMRGTGGAIINIASVAGVVGSVSPAYTAAKGGVIALGRQLAGELAPDRIRVNTVSPGFTATPLNATVRSAGLEQVLAQQIPLARWGTPDDVASACLFLASDEASYITAVNLIVDGGLSGFRDLGADYRAFDSNRAQASSR